MNWNIVVPVVLLAALLVLPAAGQTCIDYDQHSFGMVSAFISTDSQYYEGRTVPTGNAVFVGGAGLYVFDRTVPEKPRHRGAIMAPAPNCQPLRVLGDHLIVDQPSVGLIRFDITDPFAAFPVDTLAVQARELVGGEAVVFGTDGTALTSLVADDPSGLQVIATFTLPGAATAMTWHADHLYVAVTGTEPSIRVYDVADPAAPALRTSWVLPGECVDLDVDSGRLYVPLASNGPLTIHDLADPAAPLELGQAPLGSGWPYAAGDGDVLLAMEENALAVIDVSDPTAPALIREIYGKLPLNSAFIACDGGYAYVKDASSLSVIDHLGSLPPAPALIPEFASFYGASSGDFYVGGEPDGFRIADISDPSQPVAVGEVPTGDTVGLVIRDRTVFHGVRTVNPAKEAVIAYDITDPASPVEVGTLALQDRVSFLRGEGDYLVCLSPFTIVDASNPAQMTVVSQLLETLPYPQDIQIAWPYIYLMDDYAGLMVIDASDPAAPFVAGERDRLSSSAYVSMALADGLLLAQAGNWVSIFDLEDPTNPVYLRSEYGFAVRSLTSIATQGRMVYAAVFGGGMGVWDFSDPMNTRQIGWQDVRATYGSSAITVTDFGLAVGDLAGLKFMPLQCDPTVMAAPDVPTVRRLGCAPNPFNPRTAVSFTLARGGDALLEVYDLAGRRVDRLWSGPLPRGDHTFTWDGRSEGRDMASGVYFFRLDTGASISTTKAVLIR